MAAQVDETDSSAPTAPPDRSPGRLALLSLLVLAGCLALLLITRIPIVGNLLWRIAVPMALAALQALALIGLARGLRVAIHRLVSASTPPPAIPVAFDVIVGYPLWGALCYLVGLFDISRWSSGILLALGVLLLLVSRRWQSAPVADDRAPSGAGTKALGLCVILAFGVAAALTFLVALLPPFSIDELAYHLAIPRLWALEGRAVELPLLSHSYFPLGIEAADLPLFALAPRFAGLASHVLHLVIAVAACALLYRWLQRFRLGTLGSLVALAALLSTPALLITAGLSWNDWPLWGLCVALLYALDGPAEQEAGQGARPPAPAIAPLALALAGGLLCKYTFLIYGAVVVGVPLLSRWRDTSWRAALLRAGLLGGGLGSIFYLRNLVLVGNPFAPFFSAGAPLVGRFRGGTVGELLLGYIGSVQLIDEALGVTLLIPALGLGLAWRALPKGMLLLPRALACLAALALLVATRPSSRLLVPFLATVALVGHVGLERWLAAAPRWRSVFHTLLLTLVGLQLLLAGQFVDRLRPLSVILAPTKGDEGYLLRLRRGRYRAVRFFDAKLPPGAAGAATKTLVLGLNELFSFDHRVRGAGNFDGPRMVRYLTVGAKSAAALSSKLRRDGFTHVAVYWPGLPVQRADSPKHGFAAETVTHLPAELAARLRAMLQAHTQPVAQRSYAGLFRLTK